MSTPQGFSRADRVAEQVRAELMDMLLRGTIRDPRARNVLVTNVRVTDDLSMARVYLRCLEDVDKRRAERTVEAMERASGFIRRHIGQRLELKQVPSLEFFWDDSIDHGLRIERLLTEIHDDQQDETEHNNDEGKGDLDEDSLSDRDGSRGRD